MPEFRNPNQGGAGSQDNRSFLLMLVVMMGVIFGIQYLRMKTAPPAPANHAPATTAPAQTAPAAPATSQQAASNAAAAAQTPAVQATSESTTVVENELYKITFSNRGGDVTSWILKRQKDDDGRPLDLVDHVASAKFGYPMSLYTYDPALTKELANAMYVPSATGSLSAPASLSFHYAANGLDVTKTFTFGQGYLIHADTVVLKNGSPVRALLEWPAGMGDLVTARIRGSHYPSDTSVDTMQNGKDDHTASKKVSGGATLNGPFDFAGVSDQYFAATILPDHPQTATLVTLHNELPLNDLLRAAGKPAGKDVQLAVIGAAVGDVSGHNQERIFVGPKNLSLLKTIKTVDGYSLEPLLNFGFWGPFAKYLFLGLQAVHTWIAPSNPAARGAHDYSWGWAIVLFTFLIYMLLVPLRLQGMKGMLKMQRIQPQIDAIKARYKNPKPTDPKMAEMNAEIMDLQKKHGVSMFGGCIPTLVQFPLLFAFFEMMEKVVELRQAHFYWIHDLSQPDPWHILPIVMVVTSFLVQFYTPSPGVDPAQQRMMAFLMPAFSGYWTWYYAAGLALYWNVGNFIMVGQQLILNRTAIGREMREIQLQRAQAKAKNKAVQKTIQGRR
ncbi:MAG TPA: membrane protein insertase YidC [Candidatus Aquilonibacter sp.]|nr:membrane protein insertase YidC [Candidatus Aquilonibacter sp.]